MPLSLSSIQPLIGAVAVFDVLLVFIGFSLIIIAHELGHFLAARWAGIRVLAFAVGFGPALVSYRRGLGWRQGSSEREYEQRTKALAATDDSFAPDAGPHAPIARPALPGSISPTEYRFNSLPFGGYVKMLGQEDVNPTATSSAPDSFSSAPIWKRMVVISAGVLMNILLAALLFIIVYAVGLRIEPARVGFTAPGTPGATAVALNAAQAGITDPGLKPGDLITSIGGRPAQSFKDVSLASLMARPGRALAMTVERPHVATPLEFSITPRLDPLSKTLQLGVGPGYSNTLVSIVGSTKVFDATMERLGLVGVRPGMTLTHVNREPAHRYADLAIAAAASGGNPFTVTFSGGADSLQLTLLPRPAMQAIAFRLDDAGTLAAIDHVLGIVPVMMVGDVRDNATTNKLMSGDVFASIGDAQWPSIVEGMAQIRSQSGGTVSITVLRRGGDARAGSEPQLVPLGPVRVNADGTIGFTPRDDSPGRLLVAGWPPLVPYDAEVPPSGASLGIPPGSTITAVSGSPVSTLFELREAIKARAVTTTGGAPVSVPLTYVDPAGQSHTIEWLIPAAEFALLRGLSWDSPIPGEVFEPEEIVLQEKNPLAAMGVGLHETRRIILTTYLTFVRLAQGSVKVEHLKGPVGIAHMGAIVAQRGYIWLLFFLAMVSVNLAVVNFLPIPIADGGHFLMLLYERIVGKPVSVVVQNSLTMAGLGFIVVMFLIVTFNDVTNLFR
ncbi:MAG: site-2 protease family protein [Phycisphaerales bacterium]|nr:site-2 protease family protein [Phycisphaerales bacterium]